MTLMSWRWIGWGAISIGALVGASAVMMDWIAGPLRGADPLTVTPPNTPNWALAIPPGVESVTEPTLTVPVWEDQPEVLMRRFREIASAERGVEQLAHAQGTFDALVQRSRILRFPDVISVRAVDQGEGRASLAIYSRSVLGTSDFGVNALRIKRWIAALETASPPVD